MRNRLTTTNFITVEGAYVKKPEIDDEPDDEVAEDSNAI